MDMAGGEGKEALHLKRPELTFPAAVADFVTKNYADAGCILEYGSGGSTVVASEMEGKTIYAVESDKQWAENLRTYLSASPKTRSNAEVIHVDIGPTKEWGHPSDMRHVRKFPAYPFGFWMRDGAMAPEVILIDGRFRLACFYATALMTRQPVKVLFDDYGDRPAYHAVEELFPVIEEIGRMAAFNVFPDQVSPKRFLPIIESCLNPN